MTQKTWVYTMDTRVQSMRFTRKITMTCARCDKLIVIGDDVYSRNATSHKSKSKLYHKECAMLVNIL